MRNLRHHPRMVISISGITIAVLLFAITMAGVTFGGEKQSDALRAKTLLRGPLSAIASLRTTWIPQTATIPQTPSCLPVCNQKKSIAPRPKPAVSSSPQGSDLADLPVNSALTGTTAIVWADDALSALNAPTTDANVQTMVDWFASEGTPHDLNNPLNLQTPYGGSVVSTAGGSSASYRIQAYPSPADFVAAFPLEMHNGSYDAIAAALEAGSGLEGAAATAAISSELSVYSGGGYDTIPAAYLSK